ncbi:MAG: ornithine cyclodeaminase family protein [Lactobacillus sp.]|jgi:ornithine cyclodeaminase|nr:ornithine cyclodeaminase family protein [Lactobacillus sp.]
MRYLSKTNIQSLFTMTQAIQADKLALSLSTQGDTTIPLRTNVDIPKYNGQSLTMPGYVGGASPALGIKIISIYPDNLAKDLPSSPATMIALDAKTGIVSAILDGTYLTQLRTGAVQGAATDLLARQDAQTALLIGTGGQAMTQLEAMLTVRSLKLVYIFDRDQSRAQAFVQRAKVNFQTKFATTFATVASPNEVVAKVDIITTVTTAKQPTFDGSLVQPGTHINGVGAYTPAMQELPVAALQKADHIFVDTLAGALAEAGDLMTPLATGELAKSAIDGELGALLNHDIPGRQQPTDITVFKTVGTAALDIVVADQIVKAAEAQHVGIELD